MDKLKRAIDMAINFAYLPIEETKFSPTVVYHPFFESAFLCYENDIFNALEDTEKYSLFLSDFCDTLRESTSLEDLLYKVRKPYRLTFLKFLLNGKIISLKECGNLLADTWSLIEVINYDVNVPKRTILNWISHADKDKIMDESEMAFLDNMNDRVTIYRGCRNSDKKGRTGLSWTLNKDKAIWFANRYNSKDAVVYCAEIDKIHIVAFLENRGEKEVIVDYKFLENITKQEIR